MCVPQQPERASRPRVGDTSDVESVYYVVENANGTVRVMVKGALDPGELGAGIKDAYAELAAASTAHHQGTRARAPRARRCGGALWLQVFDRQPLPPGKCDDGLSWPVEGGLSKDYRQWSTVSGTTAPMNRYMKLPKNATTPSKRGEYGNDFRTVLSETYIHMWDRNFE